MLERDLEKLFIKKTKAQGWLCEKFSSPNKKGVPDRIVSVGGGVIVFVELKSKGKKPTRLQTLDHNKRRAYGFVVEIIDDEEGINQFCEKYVDKKPNA